MKFRVAFFVSKTEQSLRLRFWKWDVWQFYSSKDFETEDVKRELGKAGFVDGERKGEKSTDYGKLLFQALFYPKVEARIWKAIKRIVRLAFKFFTVRLENVEVHGTFDDPFYDAIIMGISGGRYCPDWENGNGGWNAKGELVLKISFFTLPLYLFVILYEAAILSFILWRGMMLAKKNPNGEDLTQLRRWVLALTTQKTSFSQ
ncbi:MAG: hypothetical protein LBC85_00180 [Fibromonadaceae bacterium]|jgi:hypothetical protein|nr:hypothetical protein [Fibromonadaceae bacterium]